MTHRRRQSWLILVAVVALVATYLVVWTTYAAVHVYPRYRQLAPGAASAGTAHYRVLSLTSSEVVAATEGGDDAQAQAGAVYVIATIEVRIDAPVSSMSCSMSLLGPGGQLWDADVDVPSRTLPNFCGTDEKRVQPGQPFTFENIFEIPTRYATQLRGVVVEDATSGKPEQVLIPPH